MLRHHLPLLLSFASFASLAAAASTLAACVAGVAPQTGEQNPEPTGSSTSSTDPPPAKSAGSSGSSGTSKGSLGPQCTAYMACCEEIAKGMPQLGASCDSVKTQIETAQRNGTSTSAYEPGCKSGIATFKNAGYCN